MTPLQQAVLDLLNAYEDLFAAMDDAEAVFEVMALKERLGLPTAR